MLFPCGFNGTSTPNHCIFTLTAVRAGMAAGVSVSSTTRRNNRSAALLISSAILTITTFFNPYQCPIDPALVYVDAVGFQCHTFRLILTRVMLFVSLYRRGHQAGCRAPEDINCLLMRAGGQSAELPRYAPARIHEKHRIIIANARSYAVSHGERCKHQCKCRNAGPVVR